MKHRASILISLIAILAVVAGSVLWAGPEAVELASAGTSVERPLGRDVARLGALESVEGTLRHVHEEWVLECGQESYELHLGPIGHEAALPLREGASASVRGFVYGQHIAPILLASEGSDMRFWNEDRTPSWAGQGDRRNAATEPPSGAGALGPRADLPEQGHRNLPQGAGRNRS